MIIHSKSVLRDFGFSESKIYAAIIEKLYIDWIVAPVRQQSNCADRLFKLQTESSLNKKAFMGGNFQ